MLQRNEIYPPSFCGIIGQSRLLLDLFNLIGKAAPSNAGVLIFGETGTGKELVAKAIHGNSNRSNKAFVAINCSAIPDKLIERELFGHEKGAFTDAYTTTPGSFEMSHEGTLFLDEIADMALPAQAKILRVLEEKEIKRLGGNLTIRVDVRVIAATNLDLKTRVKAGRFREDLYYRLNVLPIRVPPLRDCPRDIHLLIEHFLGRFAAEQGKGEMSISAEAVRALQKHSFPGNVRELQNIIKRAVILADGREISLSDLTADVLQNLKAYKKDNISLRIREDKLLKALELIKITNRRKSPELWRKTLKCVTIDKIYEFLVGIGGQWFSRKKFAKFLRNNAKSDTDKYKTAGDYLKILIENRICVHNGKKANKSKYKLAEHFITTAQSR